MPDGDNFELTDSALMFQRIDANEMTIDNSDGSLVKKTRRVSQNQRSVPALLRKKSRDNYMSKTSKLSKNIVIEINESENAVKVLSPVEQVRKLNFEEDKDSRISDLQQKLKQKDDEIESLKSDYEEKLQKKDEQLKQFSTLFH